MGTYDTRGGTPMHDPMFDADRALYPLEEESTDLLEQFESAHTALACVELALREKMRDALCVLVRPGMVIDLRKARSLPACLQNLKTAFGNDRGTFIFRIESEPTVSAHLDRHINATEWFCEATPISEKTGADMSGRVAASYAGRHHKITVRLRGRFGVDNLFDHSDKRTPSELAQVTFTQAAERRDEPSCTCGANPDYCERHSP